MEGGAARRTLVQMRSQPSELLHSNCGQISAVAVKPWSNRGQTLLPSVTVKPQLNIVAKPSVKPQGAGFRGYQDHGDHRVNPQSNFAPVGSKCSDGFRGSNFTTKGMRSGWSNTPANIRSKVMTHDFRKGRVPACMRGESLVRQPYGCQSCWSNHGQPCLLNRAASQTVVKRLVKNHGSTRLASRTVQTSARRERCGCTSRTRRGTAPRCICNPVMVEKGHVHHRLGTSTQPPGTAQSRPKRLETNRAHVSAC